MLHSIDGSLLYCKENLGTKDYKTPKIIQAHPARRGRICLLVEEQLDGVLPRVHRSQVERRVQLLRENYQRQVKRGQIIQEPIICPMGSLWCGFSYKVTIVH